MEDIKIISLDQWEPPPLSSSIKLQPQCYSPPYSPNSNPQPPTKSTHYRTPPTHDHGCLSDSISCQERKLNSILITVSCSFGYPDLFRLIDPPSTGIDEGCFGWSYWPPMIIVFSLKNHCFDIFWSKGRSTSKKALIFPWLPTIRTRSSVT